MLGVICLFQASLQDAVTLFRVPALKRRGYFRFVAVFHLPSPKLAVVPDLAVARTA
jgi:hypothetical protein